MRLHLRQQPVAVFAHPQETPAAEALPRAVVVAGLQRVVAAIPARLADAPATAVAVVRAQVVVADHTRVVDAPHVREAQLRAADAPRRQHAATLERRHLEDVAHVTRDPVATTARDPPRHPRLLPTQVAHVKRVGDAIHDGHPHIAPGLRPVVTHDRLAHGSALRERAVHEAAVLRVLVADVHHVVAVHDDRAPRPLPETRHIADVAHVGHHGLRRVRQPIQPQMSVVDLPRQHGRIAGVGVHRDVEHVAGRRVQRDVVAGLAAVGRDPHVAQAVVGQRRHVRRPVRSRHRTHPRAPLEVADRPPPDAQVEHRRLPDHRAVAVRGPQHEALGLHIRREQHRQLVRPGPGRHVDLRCHHPIRIHRLVGGPVDHEGALRQAPQQPPLVPRADQRELRPVHRHPRLQRHREPGRVAQRVHRTHPVEVLEAAHDRPVLEQQHVAAVVVHQARVVAAATRLLHRAHLPRVRHLVVGHPRGHRHRAPAIAIELRHVALHHVVRQVVVPRRGELQSDLRRVDVVAPQPRHRGPLTVELDLQLHPDLRGHREVARRVDHLDEHLPQAVHRRQLQRHVLAVVLEQRALEVRRQRHPLVVVAAVDPATVLVPDEFRDDPHRDQRLVDARRVVALRRQRLAVLPQLHRELGRGAVEPQGDLCALHVAGDVVEVDLHQLVAVDTGERHVDVDREVRLGEGDRVHLAGDRVVGRVARVEAQRHGGLLRRAVAHQLRGGGARRFVVDGEREAAPPRDVADLVGGVRLQQHARQLPGFDLWQPRVGDLTARLALGAIDDAAARVRWREPRGEHLVGARHLHRDVHPVRAPVGLQPQRGVGGDQVAVCPDLHRGGLGGHPIDREDGLVELQLAPCRVLDRPGERARAVGATAQVERHHRVGHQQPITGGLLRVVDPIEERPLEAVARIVLVGVGHAELELHGQLGGRGVAQRQQRIDADLRRTGRCGVADDARERDRRALVARSVGDHQPVAVRALLHVVELHPRLECDGVRLPGRRHPLDAQRGDAGAGRSVVGAEVEEQALAGAHVQPVADRGGPRLRQRRDAQGRGDAVDGDGGRQRHRGDERGRITEALHVRVGRELDVDRVEPLGHLHLERAAGSRVEVDAGGWRRLVQPMADVEQVGVGLERDLDLPRVVQRIDLQGVGAAREHLVGLGDVAGGDRHERGPDRAVSLGPRPHLVVADRQPGGLEGVVGGAGQDGALVRLVAMVDAHRDAAVDRAVGPGDGALQRAAQQIDGGVGDPVDRAGRHLDAAQHLGVPAERDAQLVRAAAHPFDREHAVRTGVLGALRVGALHPGERRRGARRAGERAVVADASHRAGDRGRAEVELQRLEHRRAADLDVLHGDVARLVPGPREVQRHVAGGGLHDEVAGGQRARGERRVDHQDLHAAVALGVGDALQRDPTAHRLGPDREQRDAPQIQALTGLDGHRDRDLDEPGEADPHRVRARGDRAEHEDVVDEVGDRDLLVVTHQGDHHPR